MQYTITISQEQYDFIMKCCDAYIDSMRRSIADQATTCLLRAQEPKPAAKPVAAKKSADAPFGYKKDGTPKKRPGRQPSKKAAK